MKLIAVLALALVNTAVSASDITSAAPSGTQCTATATQTLLGSKADGCPQDCPYDDNCHGDGLVILPCGCTSAVALETTTTTVCVTRTNCENCHWNYGLFYATPTSCPDS